MIIGIEAERANNPVKTGVEHYAKQLILHLAEIDRQNKYVLYLRTRPEAWFSSLPENFTLKIMPFPVFWTQIRLSWEMFWHKPDVLFIPASALPLLHPKMSVVTIHDLAWKFFPKTFTWFNRNFLEWSTRFAVKNAAKIIAVSQSTKKDILKFYNIKNENINVIYHGFEEIANNHLNSKELTADVTVKYQIHNIKYVLFLSTLQPRKNLEGLIDAFKLLKNENPEIKHKLVVVGKPGWKFGNILEQIEQNKDFVIYLNHISDSDRMEIMKNADLLVLPSFYEGFGMQILEAFSVGVPVATSNISSMPEVAGEAAVYFDPKNIQEIKNAIKAVLLDKSFAQKLSDKGPMRLKDFSWKKCAEETLKVLTKNQ